MFLVFRIDLYTRGCFLKWREMTCWGQEDNWSVLPTLLTVTSDVSIQECHWQPPSVHLWAYWVLRRFRFVRTGRPDHCPTSQFESETGFFQEFLLKNHLFRAYYCIHDLTDLAREFWLKGKLSLRWEWSGQGVWLVSSDKWKAPQVYYTSVFSVLTQRSSLLREERDDTKNGCV